MKRVFTLILLALSTLTGVGCGQQNSAAVQDEVYSTAKDNIRFRVETVATGLEVPWAFAWLPNGDMLVTERKGRVRVIEKGKLRTEPVFTLPDVEPTGESGLMDITLHPDFAKNNYVYLAYSYNKDGKQVKVVRYVYKDGKFTEDKTVVDHIPGAPNHSGMRCRFGPDGKLYVTAGDSTDWTLAQKLDSLAGKVLRLNDDGTIPTDNPFLKTPGARGEIWTYGNRNPQGIAWQPGSGLAFETEHGPSGFEMKGFGGDEVNILEAGKNYGWPEIHHTETREGMVSPLLEYSPACAPASGTFYSGTQFPGMSGNFFFGCLVGKRVIRVVLNGRKVVSQENLLEGVYGRIREMEQGPDGYIYFSTSNRDSRGSPSADDDRIMRLVPVH
ncbi:MAG TPA: PQQ-dependent sugar dehydrogenase [Pyrinomonadaceae bacterium]|jgi:glucose/arabinose dehydrogenase|nr:PQQ-dependent sugar dehydrogenase [Pyrinomonadaceae bacterium]